MLLTTSILFLFIDLSLATSSTLSSFCLLSSISLLIRATFFSRVATSSSRVPIVASAASSGVLSSSNALVNRAVISNCLAALTALTLFNCATNDILIFLYFNYFIFCVFKYFYY